MQAAATAQTRLLQLQSIDTAIAQLDHRRRSLPELAAIAERQVVRRRQAEELIAANTAVSDLELDQAKAEDDLVPVRQRLQRDQQRVNDGTVSDPKQLNALLDEIEHLKRRIVALEDDELEVMERLEAATGVRDQLVADRAAGEGELRALIAARHPVRRTGRRAGRPALAARGAGCRAAGRPGGPVRQGARQERRSGGCRAGAASLFGLPVAGERRRSGALPPRVAR